MFEELRGLLAKTAGIVPTLQGALRRFGAKIRWAAVYGSVAKGEEREGSDVDLAIVGAVGMRELLPVQREFGREVNVTLYSEKEFAEKLRRGEHFIKALVNGKLIGLVGSLDELEKAPRRT